MHRFLLFICLSVFYFSASAQLKEVTKEGSPSKRFNKPKTLSNTFDTSTLTSFAYDNLGKLSKGIIKHPIKIEDIDKNRMPTLIKGSMETYSQDLRRQTSEYLAEIAKFYQVKSPTQEWDIKEVIVDEIGMTHVKVNQVLNGVPIYNAELNLHAIKNRIEIVMGRGFPSPELSTVPTLSKAEAERKVVVIFAKSGSFCRIHMGRGKTIYH